MQRSLAFSLVELLVVLAIVSILSGLAIPSYNNYLIKAQVVELLSVADAYKIKLIENFFSADSNDNSVYNLDTKVIDYVTVRTTNSQPAKHIVQVVAKMKTARSVGIGLAQPAAADGALIIQLQGTNVGEVIVWSCHVAPGYNQYVPSRCQNNELEEISAA